VVGSDIITVAGGFTVNPSDRPTRPKTPFVAPPAPTTTVTPLNPSLLPTRPSLIRIEPNSAEPGAQNVPVTLTGRNTTFDESSFADFGAGISLAGPISVQSPTSITATVNIDAAAIGGRRTVTVTTQAIEHASLANGFEVTPPAIDRVYPDTVCFGGLAFDVTGRHTHWAQGRTQIAFGRGQSGEPRYVDDLQEIHVTDATHLSVRTSVPMSDLPSTLPFSISTDDEVVSASFRVCHRGSMNPHQAVQGQTGLEVVVTGENVNWVQGGVTADFGPGVTVRSLIVDSPTALRLLLDIDPDAEPSQHYAKFYFPGVLPWWGDGEYVLEIISASPAPAEAP
jgi:hypothetical protein